MSIMYYALFCLYMYDIKQINSVNKVVKTASVDAKIKWSRN